MKFETDNPKLVLILGVVVAAGLVVVGALLVPTQVMWFTNVACLTLGAVGIQVGQKS